tara:strand:- start:1128 stop:2147 length:1020 start_codon:yes stop_codon:yes gene_type:complete
MRLIILACFSLLFQSIAFSQGCCSGGGSNPIAGGSATGVLQQYQMEVSLNYQNNTSSTFFEGKEEIPQEGIYDEFSSQYLFLRTDYGFNKKLTLSLATGYHLNKSLSLKGGDSSATTSGMGDIIIFPRYDIYNETNGNIRTEVTLGFGAKLPIGYHTDSMEIRTDIWELIPPTIQLSTGGTDLMFYSFFFREYKKQKFRVFVNSLYIKKGYNSLDEKFGDYTSLSVFASKTLFRKWGLTTQIKGENVGQLQARQSKLIGLMSNEFEAMNFLEKQNATGGKKLFFIPQISYSKNNFTFFATSEIPLYQNLNGVQFASQNQFTIGINYRFLTKECPPEVKL